MLNLQHERLCQIPKESGMHGIGEPCSVGCMHIQVHHQATSGRAGSGAVVNVADRFQAGPNGSAVDRYDPGKPDDLRNDRVAERRIEHSLAKGIEPGQDSVHLPFLGVHSARVCGEAFPDCEVEILRDNRRTLLGELDGACLALGPFLLECCSKELRMERNAARKSDHLGLLGAD